MGQIHQTKMGMGLVQGHRLMVLTPSELYFRGLEAPETQIMAQNQQQSQFFGFRESGIYKKRKTVSGKAKKKAKMKNICQFTSIVLA